MSNDLSIVHPPVMLSHVLERFIDRSLTLENKVSFDFEEPKYEEAALPPDSVSWRVFKNPTTLFI